MAPDLMSAADGFIIAMLVTMVASLGVVALLFWCMRRNVARRDPQVDELLEELAEDEKREQQKSPADLPKAEPWERDADWWKQS